MALRVAVIGPESSGGRLMARLLRQTSELQVRHWSLPIGPGPRVGTDRRWPHEEILDWSPERVVMTIRSMDPMIQSQMRAGHEQRLLMAQQNSLWALRWAVMVLEWIDRPWRWVVYEALVARPRATLRWLGDWLKVELQVTEPIHDGNEQYLGPMEAR